MKMAEVEDETVSLIIICMLIITVMGGGVMYGIVQRAAELDKPKEPPASIMANKGMKFQPTGETDPSNNPPPMTLDLNWENYSKKVARMSNVAVNKTHLFFINKGTGKDSDDGDVYYQKVDPAAGTPMQIPNRRLKYIDAGDQWLWGISNGDKNGDYLWKCPAPCQNGDWTRVEPPHITYERSKDYAPDKLSSVSTNDKYVWVANNRTPFRCREPCTGGTAWQQKGVDNIPVDILSTGESQVWTLVRPTEKDSSTYIGFCDLPCDDGNWNFVGTADIDGNAFWATQGIGNDISAKDPSSIWLTTPSGVYRCQKPCYGNWQYATGLSLERQKSKVLKDQPEKNDRGDIVYKDKLTYTTGRVDVSPSYLDANSKFAWASAAGVPAIDATSFKQDIGSGEPFYVKGFL